MSAYLIEIDDTKQGVMHPTVIGPFDDELAAHVFADDMDLGTAAQNGQGGYSAAHVISDDHAITPERYIKQNWDLVTQRWEDSEFIAAAARVTAPGYQALPFDEDLTIFEETGRALLEQVADMTVMEFDAYCREHVEAPAFVVLPFLLALRDREAAA